MYCTLQAVQAKSTIIPGAGRKQRVCVSCFDATVCSTPSLVGYSGQVDLQAYRYRRLRLSLGIHARCALFTAAGIV